MNLVFTEDTKISELNKQFHEHYPYLKLQFYEDKIDLHSHQQAPGSPIKDENKTIHDILHGRVSGTISMNGHAKVKTFEHNWKEIAGLWVQVFRKSGNVWLQTTVTDDLSLADVNRFGEEMAKDVEKDALPDIHEQE